MPAKKKDVGKKKKIVTKKGKGKIEVKKGPSIDFSGVKKQDVYMKNPFKPELYPRVQGHESILKAAYGQLGGRILQGGGGVVGAPGKMLTQQPPPVLPPSFQSSAPPAQQQGQLLTDLLLPFKELLSKQPKNIFASENPQKALDSLLRKPPPVAANGAMSRQSTSSPLPSTSPPPIIPSSKSSAEGARSREPTLSPMDIEDPSLLYTQYTIPEPKADQQPTLATTDNVVRAHSGAISSTETTSSLPKAPFFTTPVMSLTDKELQKIFVYSRSKPANELTVAERNLIALARREDARRKEKPIPPQETGKIATQTGTLLDVIRAQEPGQPPSMSIDEFLEKGPPPRGGGGGGRSKEEELAMSKLPPAMKPQQQMPPLGESMYRDELVTVPSPRPLDYYASGVEAELEPGLKNIVSERRLAKIQDWADDRARYLEYKRLEKEYENSLIPFEDIRAGLVRKEMGRVYKFPWDVSQPQQFQRINPEGEEIFYTEEPAEYSQVID